MDEKEKDKRKREREEGKKRRADAEERKTREEDGGKTHRPIVPAGRQPKSRPLICRSNIRGALGWLAWLVGWLFGWLVGRK